MKISTPEYCAKTGGSPRSLSHHSDDTDGLHHRNQAFGTQRDKAIRILSSRLPKLPDKPFRRNMTGSTNSILVTSGAKSSGAFQSKSASDWTDRFCHPLFSFLSSSAYLIWRARNRISKTAVLWQSLSPPHNDEYDHNFPYYRPPYLITSLFALRK